MTLPRCASTGRSLRIVFSLLLNVGRQTNHQFAIEVNYLSRAFLLSFSLNSPAGTGSLNDCASPSIRGINDSIVWRHAVVC